jgi:hypothetical protein
MKPKVQYRVHERPQPFPILSPIYQIQTLPNTQLGDWRAAKPQEDGFFFKKMQIFVDTKSNVLTDLPFSRIQPLELAGDLYIGILKSKTKCHGVLDETKRNKNIKACDLNYVSESRNMEALVVFICI